jgi:hypothetical protein
MKTSANQQNILAAGRQDSLKSGLITCTLTGKNCAVPSLRRDTLSAKVPGSVPALTSGNAYYHNHRAVSNKEIHEIKLDYIIKTVNNCIILLKSQSFITAFR